MASIHENRFYHYARKYLREEFPEEAEKLEDTQLTDLIDKGLIAAHKFHFSTESEAMAFIDIDLRLGGMLSGEETPEWAKKLIESADLSTDEKIHLLRDAYCTLDWLG